MAITTPPRAAEIERAIDHAVRGFLRAHAAPV